MATFTFDELTFTPHPSGEGGFEAEMYFDNNWGFKVVCGIGSYTLEETEVFSTPGEYSKFEYWIHAPIDYIEPGPDSYVGPVTKTELVEVITELKNRPWVQGWYPGGMGETE